MEILCHYTKNKNAINILRSMKLKFGKIINSNDPVEIKNINFFYKGLSEVTSEIKKDIRNYLYDILHLIAFCKGNIEMNEELIPEGALYELYKRPAFYLPRMWATYGDNHKGVCFVFDKKKLISTVKKQLEKYFHFKHDSIKYNDFVCRKDPDSIIFSNGIDEKEIRENGLYNSIQSFINNNYSSYFIKDCDWKDEKEYRFICWNKINHSVKKIEIEIEEALIGIVLGINNNDNEIIKIARSKGLNNIMKIEYDDFLNLTAK